MIKIAIIGASYLQLPLIRKAKNMGIQTHVFAWECGDVGEAESDFFYPISIVEKDAILEKCKSIQIDGICSIASDLAVITVNYVAEKMGLVGNGIDSSAISVNKYEMKKALLHNNVPTARCVLAESDTIPDISDMNYPLIVKPTDRSGSRGITKVTDSSQIAGALKISINQSFEKKALIEEYVTGKEYSVECISYNGEHRMLTITEKFTTGAPHYIETGHLEPALLSPEQSDMVRQIVFRGLDALKIRYGASHSELKINGDIIKIIEIGARMGGDMIGSTLVRLSTGFDFVKAVIDICLGKEPDEENSQNSKSCISAIRYIVDKDGVNSLKEIQKHHPDILYETDARYVDVSDVFDSSSRKGYYIMSSENRELITHYMPKDN